MSFDLGDVGVAELETLSAALVSGRLRTPLTKVALTQYLAANPSGRAQLLALAELGLDARQLAVLLRVVVTERRRTQRTRDAVELVWTGPALDQERSRDTSVVARELFRAARREVLVSTFSIAKGKAASTVFGELAARMDTEPELRVRLVLPIERLPSEAKLPASQVVRRFVEEFPRKFWPGERLPEVYHYPAALAEGDYTRMHAKCIVIDDLRAFVSSANFTEAAHFRNIEAGVLVDDPTFAMRLRTEFDVLIGEGVLEPIGTQGLTR